MQRDPGYRCPKSGVGFPHGKDKKKERQKRTAERLAEQAKTRDAKIADAIRVAHEGEP